MSLRGKPANLPAFTWPCPFCIAMAQQQAVYNEQMPPPRDAHLLLLIVLLVVLLFGVVMLDAVFWASA